MIFIFQQHNDYECSSAQFSETAVYRYSIFSEGSDFVTRLNLLRSFSKKKNIYIYFIRNLIEYSNLRLIFQGRKQKKNYVFSVFCISRPYRNDYKIFYFNGIKKSVQLLCEEKDLNFLLKFQTIDHMNRKQYTKKKN